MSYLPSFICTHVVLSLTRPSVPKFERVSLAHHPDVDTSYYMIVGEIRPEKYQDYRMPTNLKMTMRIYSALNAEKYTVFGTSEEIQTNVPRMYGR